MNTYESLFKRHKNQDNRKIFSFYPFNTDEGETWETAFERLASMTKESENWNFKKQEFRNKYSGQSYPILTNYLNYTFLRVQEQKKIVFSKEKDKACFNTGLQTKRGKDIFATFFKNKKSIENNQNDWTFYSFIDSYSDKMQYYRPTPDIATYITDANDLVFNNNLEIDTNIGHIVEKNIDRFPAVLQGNVKMAENIIMGSIQSLKEKLRRNYKIAIPHWYENKIQLLLPLVLTNDDNIAELAFVVDKDKDRNIYRGKTVLTMDMAYVDARLITKPDDDWLTP
jgi:hypothetical protein